MTETPSPVATPELSVYQRLLLTELQNKPGVMQLLKVIFNDYPQVILVEHITSKAATKRRRSKSLECATLRMKMEAYIEEKIAILAGIDCAKFAQQQKEVDEAEKGKTLAGAMEVITDKAVDAITKEEDARVLSALEGKVS